MDGPCQVKINLFCSSVTVDLAETSIGSHFNLTESDRSPRKPECSSDPRTRNKPKSSEEREIHPLSPDHCTVILEYWDSAYPDPQLHVSCNFLTSYFITR